VVAVVALLQLDQMLQLELEVLVGMELHHQSQALR
jgi:hypothetical protein